MAELEAQRGHDSSGETKEEAIPALEELEQLVKAKDEVSDGWPPCIAEWQTEF